MQSKKVLDIGAGSTIATSALQRSFFGKSLELEATVLRYAPEIDKFLGRSRTHITSVEILSGIEPQSIACALAEHSVAYSSVPEEAVEGIDRVLVPGGVFKGVFAKSKHDPDWAESVGFRDFSEFRAAFTHRGYDIAEDQSGTMSVVVAIKKGNSSEITARALLEKDKQTLPQQAVQLFSDASKDFFSTLGVHKKDY